MIKNTHLVEEYKEFLEQFKNIPKDLRYKTWLENKVNTYRLKENKDKEVIAKQDFINGAKYVNSSRNISLRDYFALEIMKTELKAWNKEMTTEYRNEIIRDLNKTYGRKSIGKIITLMSYEMADNMIETRNNK